MVESTKHDAWKELGQMSKVEAMRLYVRTVEEEQVRHTPHHYQDLAHVSLGAVSKAGYVGWLTS
jgi:hypothetical protein